eukprot:TRINITY_DN21668_c0_g1_i2.p1 TRINITY_DN21668_c0_g1~~TRINITY_DN21668_c0_g1_i2.p1  ORF type:complete len:140 (-),score=42.91 TRINITY_DN21668_c0_g1_i2:312-731(-)
MFFFFFKQKTAYEMLRSLVGSEMCIRDRIYSAHCMDISARNRSKDWGEAQMHASADWCVNMPFNRAFVFLWLNYHTVHHMFPRVDFSHHPAIQKIMVHTCKEFEIKYECGNPVELYKEMVQSFASPRSLFQEALVYGTL